MHPVSPKVRRCKPWRVNRKLFWGKSRQGLLRPSTHRLNFCRAPSLESHPQQISSFARLFHIALSEHQMGVKLPKWCVKIWQNNVIDGEKWLYHKLVWSELISVTSRGCLLGVIRWLFMCASIDLNTWRLDCISFNFTDKSVIWWNIIWFVWLSHECNWMAEVWLEGPEKDSLPSWGKERPSKWCRWDSIVGKSVFASGSLFFEAEFS